MENAVKWQRIRFMPCTPLGKDGKFVTSCKEHIDLSRRAAAEGMVLLKNDGALPFKKGERIAIFGKAQIDYVKGGGGSGDVTVSYIRNIYEGLKIKEKEKKVHIFDELSEFYRIETEKQFNEGIKPGKTVEPELPDYLLKKAKDACDTALITICRYSGEGYDRTGEKYDGDFYLSKEEEAMVKKVLSAEFKKVVVVLNTGGMMDTVWFKDNPSVNSVLLGWQGGMEGGLATADILCGDVNPSGKLTDTFARSFDDYPSSETFNESDDYVCYTEDIYVGYRYFETIPGAAEKVCYPFGYGLSYTKFKLTDINAGCPDGKNITVDVTVHNVGKMAGKEVVQVYYSAPQGKLGKPSRALTAFAKTKLLKPGEFEKLTLNFKVNDMASYDDEGLIQKSAYILEKGVYQIYVGTSVRDVVKAPYEYFVESDVITQQLTERCAPTALKQRMLSDGSLKKLQSYKGEPEKTPEELFNEVSDRIPPNGFEPLECKWRAGNRKSAEDNALPKLEDVAEGKILLDDFIKCLTDEQLIHLLGGQPNRGVANTYGMGNLPLYGIPNVMTADGPAGLRIRKECGVYTTAWPCATLLACTWDPQLVYEVGAAGAEEVKENGMGIWLTPALNIHRNPLCGRNFEYYSEDPLVSGKMAAAMIKGIQSNGIAASAKHFCCNNKETKRKHSDSRVSERALREIYLKGFEIAVKEAKPWTVMTSYNLLNGIHTSANKDLIMGILREEWGYKGMVESDWYTTEEQWKEIKAGNDVKMGCGSPEETLQALEKGKITRADLEACVTRLLEMILKLD